MMPVEEGNTSEGGILSKRAASAHTRLEARIPSGPVAQFAFPEFTRTARARPPLVASALRPISTGAATIRFLVNRAAAVVPGPAEISPRSGFWLALMPAATAEYLNPRGRKIGSDELMRAVLPASLPPPAKWRIAAAHL